MLRRLTSKPRGLLRDITLVLALIFFYPNALMAAIGSGLFIIGLILHVWSKACLVRNWCVTTCGPYRLVRHPFYLANFLIDVGFCLISGNWWLTALYVVAFLFVYLRTIRKEELSLTSAHGDAYTSYARKVPALLPYRLHAIFGPLDCTWDNLKREGELSRLLRILAIPSYFVVVAALFHATPSDGRDRGLVLCIAATLALLLNAAAAAARGYERRIGSRSSRHGPAPQAANSP